MRSSAGDPALNRTSSVGAADSRRAVRTADPAAWVSSGLYSSSVTWKLVPPKPKLDTEARRGYGVRPGGRTHGRAAVFR